MFLITVKLIAEIDSDINNVKRIKHISSILLVVCVLLLTISPIKII